MRTVSRYCLRRLRSTNPCGKMPVMKLQCQIKQEPSTITKMPRLRSHSSKSISSGPTVATSHTNGMELSTKSSRRNSLKLGQTKTTTPTRRSANRSPMLCKVFSNTLFRSRPTFALSSNRSHTWSQKTQRILSLPGSKALAGISSGSSTRSTS